MKLTTLILAFSISGLKIFGQTWENVGEGLDDNVYDLHKFNDKLYAGGRMGVKFWNDTSWTSLPDPYGIATPLTFATYKDTIYVGGDFPYTGSISHVYKFDGASWIQVGGDFDEEYWSSTKRLLTYNDQLISGGHYTSINGAAIYNISSWNGSTWSSLGEGLNGPVWNLAEHNGDLYASGDFISSGIDSTIKHIAKWNGTNWSALDPSHSFNSAGDMISFDSLLIIGNVWDTIAGNPMSGIAVWNGTSFISWGNNLIKSINNFWVFNNELFLCGKIFTLNPNDYANVVLKWNNFFWEQVGLDFDQPVLTVDDFSNQLFCGGFYEDPALYVAKLDITTDISEFSQEIKFQFYPNPAHDYVDFITSNRGSLTITNQIGQFVDVILITENQTRISTENLSAGIYFLTFQTENNFITSKLIIQKM